MFCQPPLKQVMAEPPKNQRQRKLAKKAALLETSAVDTQKKCFQLGDAASVRDYVLSVISFSWLVCVF